MLVKFERELSPEEREHFYAVAELLKEIEPEVEQLFASHLKKSKRWYPHEVLPWGAGTDFNKQPYEPSSVRPEVVASLETNLLTEDNLPYYHAKIEQMFPEDSIWQRWNRRWTAEEGGHAAALRDYLYLSRVMDPKQIEDNRLVMMESGYDRTFNDALEIFAYTAVQELATRVSHLRTGQLADEECALKLCSLIARDENFHFIFYRGVCNEVLRRAPDLMLQALFNQLSTFEMPGATMSGFELKKAMIADAGVYGAREHRDQVLKPVLSFWGIDSLTGLSEKGQRAQEKILKLVKVMDRLVEHQERRMRKTD